MDFEDNTNNEEEDDDAVSDSPPLPLPSHILRSSTERPGTTSTGGGGFMVVHGGSRFRFRECLKNQAVNIGGHAVDGCGEFMPAGNEGTIDALKCAACGCHRNFHRKELPFHHLSPPPPPGVYSVPAPVSHRAPPSQAPPLQMALPPPQRGISEDGMETSSAEAGGGGIRKRFRTKFTAEQKERMLRLAERIGWRIQRQDDEVIQRFCEETGVPRQVLKVWLHNNKHSRGMSSSSQLDQHQNPTLHPPPQSSLYHHEQEQP